MATGNIVFCQWGLIQFQVWPLNYHEMDHQTGSSYARKEVMEAIPQREWTGEDDEEITLRGRVFPFRVGGFDELNIMDSARREGSAHILVMGSSLSNVMGWYVCERLNRRHRMISSEGYGRVIEFDALFSRCDTPNPAGYISDILPQLGGNVG